MSGFTTTTLAFGNGQSMQITAERTVCPHLVITPQTRCDSDGNRHLDAGLVLTHAPTGRSIASRDRNSRLRLLAADVLLSIANGGDR